jgi:hypothetical protein
MFKTGTFGNGYISDSFVLPDEYSCNPFSIKYSGVFYYQDYFTYQYVQLGEFTITFTF